MAAINLEGVLTACKHIYVNNILYNQIQFYPVDYYPHVLCPLPGTVRDVGANTISITLDDGRGIMTMLMPLLLGGVGTTVVAQLRRWAVGDHINAGDVIWRIGTAIQYGGDEIGSRPHGGNPCVRVSFPGPVGEYIDIGDYTHISSTWLCSEENMIDYDHGFSAVFFNYFNSQNSADFFVKFVEDGEIMHVMQVGEEMGIDCDLWIDDEDTRWLYEFEGDYYDAIRVTTNRCMTAGYGGNRTSYNIMRIGIRAYGAGPDVFDSEGDYNYVQPPFTHYPYRNTATGAQYLVPAYKYDNWGDTDLIPIYAMESVNLFDLVNPWWHYDWTSPAVTINTIGHGDYLYMGIEPVLFPRPGAQGVMWTYRLRYGKTDSARPPFSVGVSKPIYWWYSNDYVNRHYNAVCYNNYAFGTVGYVGPGDVPTNGSYYIVGHNGLPKKSGDDSIIPILTMLSSHNTAMPSINRFLRPR